MDGTKHRIEGKWDLLIAHPPCTYLTISANKYYNVDVYGEKAIERAKKREEAYEFFMKFIKADCDRIAVENPVGVCSTRYKKPTQIIQPYWFGHNASKKTCLWLKGLPPLIPTKIVDSGEWQVAPSGKRSNVAAGASAARDENGKILAWNDPRTAKIRSKTFQGVAEAIAKQWGDYLMKENENA